MSLNLAQVSLTLHGAMLIQPFSIMIARGELVTLMGPSGCGKSALLAYIAGDIEAPLAGQGSISLDGRDLREIAPEARRVGRLFQDDLLFPHLSVGGNLLFGMARGQKAERMSRMRKALADIGLAGFEERLPHSLSGGQRARVALMRALLAEPLCMLLDEPFGKLDQELKDQMRALTFAKLGSVPTLMVTHDPSDAPRGGRVLRITREGEISDA